MKHKASCVEDLVAELAIAADVDRRTVWKHLAGGKVRGRAAARVDRAMAARLAKKSEEAGG